MAQCFSSIELDVEKSSIESFKLSKEIKKCGHVCYPSSTPFCCSCSDKRLVIESGKYPMYVDGQGWVDNASRDEYYCHVCNPKNYSLWEEKICKEREIKQYQIQQLHHQLEIKTELRNHDIQRAANLSSHDFDKNVVGNSTFHYSNGDKYIGEMKNGLRHGKGSMIFSEDESSYDGEWVLDHMTGFGVRNWGDGIVYEGEWKDNMMHGHGHYTMAHGEIFQGRFEEDIFIG
mmetsp:Transcript_40501/g.41331  ORF Transcript_40501/g.41331 Transcript_40501/m.41331 type:complete len:231 (+) Transcript_40501:30-722(+)